MGEAINGETGDYSAYEKAALVAWHLAHGEGMRTVDIEAMTGLTRQGVHYLMQHLCRKLPIYQDDDGFWCVIPTD